MVTGSGIWSAASSYWALGQVALQRRVGGDADRVEREGPELLARVRHAARVGGEGDEHRVADGDQHEVRDRGGPAEEHLRHLDGEDADQQHALVVLGRRDEEDEEEEEDDVARDGGHREAQRGPAAARDPPAHQRMEPQVAHDEPEHGEQRRPQADRRDGHRVRGDHAEPLERDGREAHEPGEQQAIPALPEQDLGVRVLLGFDQCRGILQGAGPVRGIRWGTTTIPLPVDHPARGNVTLRPAAAPDRGPPWAPVEPGRTTGQRLECGAAIPPCAPAPAPAFREEGCA